MKVKNAHTGFVVEVGQHFVQRGGQGMPVKADCRVIAEGVKNYLVYRRGIAYCIVSLLEVTEDFEDNFSVYYVISETIVSREVDDEEPERKRIEDPEAALLEYFKLVMGREVTA